MAASARCPERPPKKEGRERREIAHRRAEEERADMLLVGE